MCAWFWSSSALTGIIAAILYLAATGDAVDDLGTLEPHYYSPRVTWSSPSTPNASRAARTRRDLALYSDPGRENTTRGVLRQYVDQKIVDSRSLTTPHLFPGWTMFSS